MKDSSVLIVSDEIEFGRTVAARWRAEVQSPEITLVTGDIWESVDVPGHDLVIIGSVRERVRRNIFSALKAASAQTTIYVSCEEKDAASIRTEFPQVLVMRQEYGWLEALIVVSREVLRRLEALRRARRAESVALACEREAMLGRYMLEMRPSVNNALTSVLGNADLLLLDAEQSSPEGRQQIQTIHAMVLRLSEIMQRFSSLASEMRLSERESQIETELLSQHSTVRC